MASQAYDRALQLDRSNTSTQTKLAMIQDLFGDGARDTASPARNTPAPAKSELAVAAIKMESKSEPASPEPAAPITVKPVAGATPSSPPADQVKEVLKAVDAWAAAWSSRDANKYLSFYAADFKTPDQENRADWEAARQERISKPKSIQIGISNATVKFSDSDHATVSFRQSYRASHLRTSGKKTLLMVRSGGKWLIQEERSR
jgi:ketosteroid isomerase-like protein